jgi:transcriptional regulator with XRE-family HTH domain
MSLQNIGIRIHHLRVEVLDLSQREFAQRMGVAQGNLSLLETGQSLPSCFFLWCLHATFGVNLHWIMSGQGQVLLTKDLSSDQVLETS